MTEAQRKKAEAILKMMEAPSGGTPPGKTSGKPGKKHLPERHVVQIVLVRRPRKPNQAQGSPSAFQSLKPTDIVVVGGEPASVRTVDKSGKAVSSASAQRSKPGVKRRLFAHSHHHTDTVLRVWTQSDTIEYQCDEPFEIVEMKRAGWKLYGAPEDPFTNKKPYKAKPGKRPEDGKPFWFWRSSRISARANNQQYKATFKIGDRLIDPDVVCGSPPPI